MPVGVSGLLASSVAGLGYEAKIKNKSNQESNHHVIPWVPISLGRLVCLLSTFQSSYTHFVYNAQGFSLDLAGGVGKAYLPTPLPTLTSPF